MKAFNIEFQEYKQSVSGLSSLSEDSFTYWVHNFVNKKEEFNPFNFLIGKIYSFEYMDKIDKNKKFINKRPVVFFTGFLDNTKLTFSGIDLILMPPIFRIAFLTRIKSVFQSQIETNIKKIAEGGKLDQIQLKSDYNNLNLIMQGIPFKNPYRSWDIKKVRDIKEISYEDWTKIVYLHTRSIEGDSIEEIYNKNSKI